MVISTLSALLAEDRISDKMLDVLSAGTVVLCGWGLFRKIVTLIGKRKKKVFFV